MFGEALELPEAFGRGGVRRWGEVVVRPYRRGGLLRHVNERLYVSATRFAQEFVVHRVLWQAGFPTVEPVGYAWKRRAWGVEGCYFTRYAPIEPWPRHWETPGVTQALKAQIQALCDWGLHAPDLNATNVMLGPEGVLLLDWDRAEWTTGELFSRYRARLLRSLEKLGAPNALRQEVEAW